ncbi:hypothetical protein HY642_00180 [Candidatus Woesearchaeota archaeon]|nr:hypothetical protein [Candidatus Woesearchaeota archaeon]
MPTICVFGDSIVHGASDVSGGWVRRLYAWLEPQDIRVYNLGVSGDFSNQVLARFEAEADAREAEIIILAVGINDAAQTKSGASRVPLQHTHANIGWLLTKAKQRGVVVVVGLTNVDEQRTCPVAWDADVNYRNAIIKRYDSAIAKLCKKQQVLHIPVFGKLAKADLEDGLHPTGKGHEKIFRAVADFLLRHRIVEPVPTP